MMFFSLQMIGCTRCDVIASPTNGMMASPWRHQRKQTDGTMTSRTAVTSRPAHGKQPGLNNLYILNTLSPFSFPSSYVQITSQKQKINEN